MADHQFEQKVSQQLADFKLKPNAEVWQQVEEQLQEDKRRRRWFIFLPIAALFVGGLLYAVWPEEAPTKTNATVQQNNKTNNTTTPQQNTAPLTETGSSNSSTEQPPVEEKTFEGVISGKANLSDIVVQQQPAPAKEVIQRKQKNSNGNAVAIVETKPKESNVDVVVSKDDPVAKEKETLAGNTTKIEQKTELVQQTDSVSSTESMLNKTAAVDSNKASLVVDSTVVVSSPSKPTITKRKWQLGLHVSTGLSDIRGSLFPGSGFKSFSYRDYSPTGIGNGGQGGPTRIVQYDYAIKPSAHFGAGVMLRKPFKKRNAFVTGLQYQYSSYSVTQRQRIDTFILANNYFSNISIKEKTVKFNMHAVNVPLELEFKIADIKKGTLLLNAGIQNWFVVSSTQTDTLSSFRYTASADRSAGYGGTVNAKETKATIWQPQLYLSPSYEWKGKSVSSQLGFYLDYGLRPAYKSTSKDYWWQMGIRYRMYFNR